MSRADQLRLHDEESRRCRSATSPYPPEAFVSAPRELLPQNGTPDTIAGWKALADGLLTDQCLRVPPQRGDLVTLCLDLQAPARLLQVGRDGRDRVAPRPARPLPAPAGHRSHRLRGHPAQPGSPQAAADGGREHDPGDEQRHLRRHLLGPPRLRHRRRRDRTPPRSPASGAATTRPSSPASRRSTTDAASWRTRRRPREARRAADDLIWEGNVQLLEHEQRALVQPNFDRLSCAFARLVSIGSATSFEVRGVRQEVAYFTSFYLYSLTRGIPHALRARRVAEDHPLRRPLALARDERRSPLPEVRCRHAPDRRQPATHPRRSARLRVDPLRPAASAADERPA